MSSAVVGFLMFYVLLALFIPVGILTGHALSKFVTRRSKNRAISPTYMFDTWGRIGVQPAQYVETDDAYYFRVPKLDGRYTDPRRLAISPGDWPEGVRSNWEAGTDLYLQPGPLSATGSGILS